MRCPREIGNKLCLLYNYIVSVRKKTSDSLVNTIAFAVGYFSLTSLEILGRLVDCHRLLIQAIKAKDFIYSIFNVNRLSSRER